MSFFNNLFGSDTNELNSIWKVINSGEALAAAKAISKEKSVVIFKHSTRCIISKTVLRNFENEMESTANLPFDPYLLDLLNHRDISNQIAEDFGVTHQSPQALLIKDEKVVYNTSHDGISLEAILKYIG